MKRLKRFQLRENRSEFLTLAIKNAMLIVELFECLTLSNELSKKFNIERGTYSKLRMHLSCWYIYSICFWVNVCTLESSYTFIQTKQKLNTTKTECRKIFQWEIGAHLSHQYLFVCILLIYNTFVILFSLTINAHQLRNKKENNLWLNLAATVFPSIQSVIDANVIKKKKEKKKRVYVSKSNWASIWPRSTGIAAQGKALNERCSFIFLGREHMCYCKSKKSMISLESDFYRCRNAVSVRWTFWNNADTL